MLAANALGLVEAGEHVLYDTADRLDLQAEACRPASESFVNPAKILAIQLADTIPVVLGDGPLNGVAAVRAASMLARTARMPALVRRAAGRRLADRGDVRRPVHLGRGGRRRRGAGTGGERRRGADIFADPFLDGRASPVSGC